jgi:hypothetical protein
MNAGTLNVAGGAGALIGELSGTAGATVVFPGAEFLATRITQASLTVNAAGTSAGSVIIAAAGTLGMVTSKVNALNIAGGATPAAQVDLANTNLVVDYATGTASPLATVRAQIRSGYNPGGPAWTGNGITSSEAATHAGMGLGYAEASDALGLTGSQTVTWFGQTVDATSVLIRYTKSGDANLDGVVDFADLVKLAQHYNDASGGRTWFEGDFNYDGNVDFNDLVAIAQNYNTGLSGQPTGAELPAGFEQQFAAAMASVPEPGGVAVAGVIGCVWCGRRRRRGRLRYS